MDKKIIKHPLLFCIAIITIGMVIFANPTTATEPVKQQGLVDKARVTFENFMADEQNFGVWFRKNLHEAKGGRVRRKRSAPCQGYENRPMEPTRLLHHGFRDTWAADWWRGSGSGYDGEDPKGCG